VGVKKLYSISLPSRLSSVVPSQGGTEDGGGQRGGETFWEKIYKEMTLLCQEGNARLPSTSLRSAQGDPRLALRPLAAARVEGSQLQIHVLSGNVASGKNFFFRLSSSEIEQE